MRAERSPIGCSSEGTGARWGCGTRATGTRTRFGSRVNGIPTPGSDVDVCLVLTCSDKPFRDRAADYLPLGFPVGLDLFPYTVEEFERLRSDYPSWHGAITAGVDLLPER